MAKRTAEGNHPAGNDRLNEFAEELGRLLGTAQSRASTWLDQRKALSDQLVQIRDAANRLLGELGHQAGNAIGAVRRGRRSAAGASRKRSAPARKAQANPAKAPGKKKLGPPEGGTVAERVRRQSGDAAKARSAERRKKSSPAGNR